MQAAIKRVESGESARAVAQDLGLPRSSLSRRVQNHQYILTESPNVRKLSAKAEEEVCNWIVAEEAGGHAPNTRQIRAFVAILLRQQGLPDFIGHNWLERFYQRHSDVIKKKKRRLIIYKKILTNRLDEIEHWFRRLHRVIQVRQISPNNIYNMDETGLQQGFQSNSKVFGSTLVQIDDRPSNTDTAWVTIIECIGAEGKHVTPGAIFTGSHLWTDSTPEQPPPWIFSSSNSGFSNQSMMISWFKQAFLKDTSPNTPSDWRLLIMDGHKSHDSDEFRHLAFSHRIQPF